MSNETDLDWLARNVHKWPEGMHEVLVRRPRNVDELIWSSVLFLPNAGWITKDQWLARRAELQKKPRWGGAPTDAHYIAQGPDGVWGYWHDKPAPVKEKNDSGAPVEYWGGNNPLYIFNISNKRIGEVLGDWRDTLEKRPADLSEQAVTARLKEAADNVLAAAPELMTDKYKFEPFVSIEDHQEQEMKQDNGWFERGELPPVGIAVQLWHGGTYAYDCELIAKRGNDFVLWNLTWDRPDSADCMMCVFKPTPTECEMLADLIESHGQMSALVVADAILAAGFSLRDK